MELQLLAIFVLCNVLPVLGTISCMDDTNQPVDWYAVYKIPKTRRAGRRSLLGRGESYAYLNRNITHNRKYEFVLSEKGVSYNDSILGNTLKAFYNNKKDLTYLLYNDEPAAENPIVQKYHTVTGHTKGVLVFDEDSGFWLVHSIPKFPPENAYVYPKTGLMFGQSALCVTFKTEQLNEIGKQLLFNRPDIYSKGCQKAVVSSLDEDVQSLFGDKPQFVEKPPFLRTAALKSFQDATFISFAKDDRFNEDLYSDFVAPYLKIPLFVETWRRGAGTPLPPSCDTQYTVEDIKFIRIFVLEGSTGLLRTISFSSFYDHSKWAVSSDAAYPWVCVGDINRMKSQWRRGGGTVCFISPEAHAGYTSVITETDKCESFSAV